MVVVDFAPSAWKKETHAKFKPNPVLLMVDVHHHWCLCVCLLVCGLLTGSLHTCPGQQSQTGDELIRLHHQAGSAGPAATVPACSAAGIPAAPAAAAVITRATAWVPVIT